MVECGRNLLREGVSAMFCWENAMKKLKFFIGVILILPCLLLPGTSGKVKGRVIDENGSPLAGVNVYLEGTYIGASTDMDGNYVILNIPPGIYTLVFSMIGYETRKYRNVKVQSDLTTIINAQLSRTVIEGQEVVVVAETPIVQKDLTSTEYNISSDVIETLPVSDIQDVLNLQAGMVDGHMRGGRATEINYMIDGISINDAYGGTPAVLVENDIVQELKVVSGTFNAEYGQAQSGIVDISTKEGADKFTMSFSSMFGDYVSSHTRIFENINVLSPVAYMENTLYLSGPILKKLRYIVTFKRLKDEGYIYGKNFFLPSVPNDSIAFGDGSYEPMNHDERYSLFFKISYRLNSSNKLFVTSLFQKRDYSAYDHMFKWNPGGLSKHYERSGMVIFGLNHVFSERSFFNLKFSYSKKSYNRYVFKDSTDERYSTDDRMRQTPVYSFYTGGTDMAWFTRYTKTGIVKFDYTNQITNIHQIKAGFEYKTYELMLHDIKLKKNPETNFEVRVPPPNTADNQYYLVKPYEFSAFIQTKSEYEDFILNLGVRLDYFDSRGDIIIDLSRPKTSDTRKAKPDIQISPRIGMAYPITDKGVMHISYGHFFQIPPFEYLYANPSRSVNPEMGRASVLAYPFGNPELRSQKTVAFEIGLQQELAENVGLDATAYYKDIRNLLGTEINTIAPREEHSGVDYGRFINLDYGQVKGFTLAIEKRPGGSNFGVSLDYTYQVAKGNSSDPRSVLIDNMAEPPKEPEKQMVYLDWDQRHTINASFTYYFLRDMVLTVIGRYGSGQPYTPQAKEVTTALKNSDRKPSTLTFDMFFRYLIPIGKCRFRFIVKVLNVFDRLNEKNVYSDSGRAGFTTELFRGGEAQGYNTKKEFFTRPDWYSPPRLVQIGFEVGL